MSDEEEYNEEEDEEIEAEEAPPEEAAEEEEVEAEAEEAEPEPEPEPEPEEVAPPPPKLKPRPIPAPSMDDGDNMTEAEKAMLAAKKKHEEEEAIKLEEFEKNREIEKQKQEEELEILKEKQRKRQEEREEDEAKMAEMKEKEEEARKHDEEMKQKRIEADKTKKDADKRKRQQMAMGSYLAGGEGGRNFVVPKKEAEAEGGEGEVSTKPKGLSKEEYDQLKKQYMINTCRPLDLKGRDVHGLRDLIKTMHKRIESLETKKYDMEKRCINQEYDLRELNERRKQSERQKALKKGLDPEEAANSQHPPKIQVSSKFDRQIDRRPYSERQQIYAKPKRPAPKKLFHGSARPPPDFGRPAASIEELELLRKNMEPPKYVEEVHMDGAKPPVKPVPITMPKEDEPEPAPVAAE